MSRRKEPKPEPTLRELAERQRIYCFACPAWVEFTRPDGSAFPVPITNAESQPVLKDGVQQNWRHKNGRIVTMGACCLFSVKRVQGHPTGLPEARSDWWCEDPAKHDLIARVKAMGNPDA